ncbi:hypothetical protein GCM10009537_11680 [Corynebacterium riegelii]
MLRAANPGHPPTPSGRRSPSLPSSLRLLALRLLALRLLALRLLALRLLVLVTLVLLAFQLAWPR